MSVQTDLDAAFEEVADQIKARVPSLNGAQGLWIGTREEYDNLLEKQDDVVYVIKKTPTP